MATPLSHVPQSGIIGSSHEAATFNFEDADVTLRSSDGVDFHVHKWLLSKASSLFATLFDLPQPDSTTGDRRITCDMSEDSQSIKLLVAYCYPRSLCKEPLLEDIGDVERAFALGKKFDLSFIMEAAERALEKLAAALPDIVYAMAWRFELSNVVRLAAFASLEHPFLRQAITPAFVGVPAEALIRLWDYRSTRVADAMTTLKDASLPISWIREKEIQLTLAPANGSECCCDDLDLIFWDKPAGVLINTWWWGFVCGLVNQMYVNPRDTITLSTKGVFHAAMLVVGECPVCSRSSAAEVLHITIGRLQQEVYRRIREIPFETPF